MHFILGTKSKLNNVNVTGTQQTGSSEFIFAVIVKNFNDIWQDFTVQRLQPGPPEVF